MFFSPKPQNKDEFSEVFFPSEKDRHVGSQLTYGYCRYDGVTRALAEGCLTWG